MVRKGSAINAPALKSFPNDKSVLQVLYLGEIRDQLVIFKYPVTDK
jgi:hypothetical protein